MQLGAGGHYLGPASASASAAACAPTRPVGAAPAVVGGAATPSPHGGSIPHHGGSCSIPCSP
eukprot:scaffold43089_cov24-Phaeocystis_antarctica.AAC.1